MKEALYAMAGDTFFTHSSTLLGRLIRWGETDPGEAKDTWANHTGVVVQSGWIGGCPGFDALGPREGVQAVVIEALGHVRRCPLDVSKIEVRVFRPIPAYTAAELGKFTLTAESYVGATYGWWKLLFQLADRQFFKGKKVLTTALHLDSRPICSYLAGRVNQWAQSKERIIARVSAHVNRDDNGSAYYSFGMPPQAADPDEMMDYALANPTEWQEIR